MTKYWLQVDEQIIEAESEDEALEKYRKFLEWLSTRKIRSKKETAISNPQLDEYVVFFEYE